MRAYILALLAAAIEILAGCGGGGSPPSSVPVRVAIHWGPRTRALNAPSSALSAKIILLGSAPDGGDVSFVVNRDPNPAEYTATASSGQDARPGKWDLRAEFHALADGEGDIVGAAQANVMLRSGSPILNADGSPLPAIATAGRIASVRLLPRQIVSVSEDTDLHASAYDSDYELIAIAPGSFTFNVSSGTGSLTLDQSGRARGTLPGIVYVSATADGKTSTEWPVYILPDVTIRSIPLNADDIAWDPVSRRLYAGIPGSEGPGRGNTIAVIDPSTASIDRFIPVGSEPGRIAVTDDGQFLYVHLRGSGAVRRISLASLTADLQFSVGWPNNPAPQFVDLSALPGAAHAVAVNAYGSRVAVYDDGIMRPDVIDQGGPQRIERITAGTDSTRLYGGYYTVDGRSGVAVLSVDGGGVRIAGAADGLLASPVSDNKAEPIRFFSGRIYAANGVVIDPGQPAIVGALPVIHTNLTTDMNVQTVDADRGRAYYSVDGSFENSDFVNLSHLVVQGFDTARYAQVSRLDFPEGLSASAIVSFGAGKIAIAVHDFMSPSRTGIMLISNLKD